MAGLAPTLQRYAPTTQNPVNGMGVQGASAQRFAGGNPNGPIQASTQLTAPAQRFPGGDPNGPPQGPTLQSTLPIQSAPANASGAPAYVQGPSPDFGVASVLNSFAPQAAMSTNALNNELAAAGITGGGAVDAQTALQDQLARSISPALAQVYGQYAGDTLQANEFNAGNYNSLQQMLLQLAQGQYMQQGAQTASLYGGALGNAGQLGAIGANQYPVYSGPNTSGLGAALAGFGGQATPAAPNPVSNISYTPTPVDPGAPVTADYGNFG